MRRIDNVLGDKTESRALELRSQLSHLESKKSDIDQMTFLLTELMGCYDDVGNVAVVTALMEIQENKDKVQAYKKILKAVNNKFNEYSERGLELSRFKELLDLVEINEHVHEKDRKSTRLNSSYITISYAVFCLKKKNNKEEKKKKKKFKI